MKIFKDLRTKSLFNKTQNTSLILFCLSVFIVILPPIYLLPFQSAFLTSHSIARYIILLVFLLILINHYVNNRKTSLNKRLVALILFYFITQSISILAAVNIQSFFIEYKDTIFSVLIFFVTVSIINKKNILTLVKYLLIAGISLVIYEFIVYFYPTFVYSYLKPILYEQYWRIFDYQLNRQRFFGDLLVEILVPLIIYYSSITKNISNKILLYCFTGAITFFSFVSNWRSKAFVLVFALLSSLFLYTKKGRKLIFAQVSVFCFFLLLAYFVSSRVIGYSAIDRIISPNKEDLQALSSRIEYWNEAYSIALSSPLVGIGLGNYFDYLPQNLQESNKSSLFKPAGGSILIDDPHNIFFTSLVNTGFLGLFSFMLLIFYFAQDDISKLKKHKRKTSPFILMFWSLFSYALFNPGAFFSYQMLFWLLRGVIYKLDE